MQLLSGNLLGAPIGLLFTGACAHEDETDLTGRYGRFPFLVAEM